MDDLTYKINIIENDVKRLISVVEGLTKANKNNETETKRYYSLRDAVKLKYGESISYTTISTNYLLQPCCGKSEMVCCHKKFWTYDLIQEYLTIQDKDIPAYAAKYGVPLVGRLGEKYKKYIKES